MASVRRTPSRKPNVSRSGYAKVGASDDDASVGSRSDGDHKAVLDPAVGPVAVSASGGGGGVGGGGGGGLLDSSDDEGNSLQGGAPTLPAPRRRVDGGRYRPVQVGTATESHTVVPTVWSVPALWSWLSFSWLNPMLRHGRSSALEQHDLPLLPPCHKVRVRRRRWWRWRRWLAVCVRALGCLPAIDGPVWCTPVECVERQDAE